MGKANSVDLRFAVGRLNEPRSGVWRAFSRGSEVYLAAPPSAGREKFSFHSSGICRHAFTKEEGPGDGEDDRVISRWIRSQAPPAPGVSYALLLRFPCDYLSSALAAPTKRVTWVPSASVGGSTTFEFCYTQMNRRDAEAAAAATNRTLLSHTLLPSGEAFTVTWLHEPWLGEPFRVPGLLYADCEYFISRLDLENTGRPVRFLRILPASDGVPSIAEDFGAYKVPLGTTPPETMGVLQRNKVLKRRVGDGGK